MYCVGGTILHQRSMTLCCLASYSNLSSINYFFMDNNPGVSGFGMWPERNFIQI